jgi:serine protease
MGQPAAASEQADRVRQIRLVAARRQDVSMPDARRVVARLLGDGWQVERLTRSGRQLLVWTHGEQVVGTQAHARASHEAGLALSEAQQFAKVEADVPIRGYAENLRAVPAVDAARGEPAGAPLYWVHETLRWQQALDAMPDPVRGGVGISIGQPDTGYTLHPNLGVTGLDLDHDWDVISDDDDALDDLHQNPLWPLPFPGHGTSTASVVVGHGDVNVGIVGLAPAARLVPFRATESVVQLFDSDVARAVARAREVGCHVVTMSLGGKGFFGLEDQIQRAVDQGIIVMAAAGNYVGFVTAPASYANCLAVAATGPGDTRWDGSSRGRAVDVSMPGAEVPVARFTEDRQPIVGPSDGTSFSVAHLAAAAALWLATHGPEQLIATYGRAGVQAAFLAVLRWPGVCVVPPDWDDEWGIGRVDLPSLLAAPLPAAADIRAVRAFRTATDTAAGRIAAALNADPVAVRARLASLLHAEDPHVLAELLDRHEGELVYLAYTDPDFAAAVSSTIGAARAARAGLQTAGVSGRLESRLSGA